ncbi:hypothetical protein [Pseudomonas sp. TE3610]
MKLMEWRDHGQSTATQPLPLRRSWLREGLILLSIPLTLVIGYASVFHFAAHAMTQLVTDCTARLEAELFSADLVPTDSTVSADLCNCLARTLLDKNGILRLALVDVHRYDPMALQPLTDVEEGACVDQWWRP